MSIFTKMSEATEAYLDGIIAKAKTSNTSDSTAKEYAERKGLIELSVSDEQQYGYKERTGLVGAGVLKNMARKDSVIIAIINTKLAQVHSFCKEQKDKYSPGWVIAAENAADLTDDEKSELSDPALQDDEEQYKTRKFELEKKRLKLKQKQQKDISKIKEFIKHCGMPPEETDTTRRRWDFDKFVRTIVWDRLVYNYAAIELIPTRDGEKLHHFYPLSAGTVKYVSVSSGDQYTKMIEPILADRKKLNKRFDSTKPFRYVQLVRGKIVAAFTEDELIFEPATPTVDPEDNGYSPGELEQLIQIITAHLYAEAHNRNFFTQGIGTKGILHIKGDNINRAQLEAFKRQWFNQVVSSRNAFRPPIIGMADDVKWVSLAQTNQEMEFEKWMQYLIKITCAIYQVDPSEINFDISKTNTSTLQEGNNEEKLKASKDKGLRPLLDYIENLINNHILRYWDQDLADNYKFRFVGFDAESRKQEMERLKTETSVWKTLNEARIEMGSPPIEHADIVLNATYTQYLAQKAQAEQAENGLGPDGQPLAQEGDQNDEEVPGIGDDVDSFTKELNDALSGSDKEDEKQAKQDEADAKAKQKASEVKKSEETPTIVEYYLNKDESDKS